MSKNGSIGFGLLGAGLVAPFHARSLNDSEKCHLVAVTDLDKERADKFADEFGCKAYYSLDDMLADDGIACVNVLTPNSYHCDAVLQAANAGKHVLVEKPPAMSLKETDLMIETCKANNVKFGVTVQCRVRKPIQAIKTAIAQGRFGKLLMAGAYMKWFRTEEYYLSDAWRSSRKSGAGVTIQHAFHYLDLLQYLMGPCKNAQAKMLNLAHPKVELEDTLIAFVEFENGANGVVEASTGLWPGTDIRIEINGENGTAIMIGEAMETWKFKDERQEDEEIRTFGDSSVGTAATGPTAFGFADHKVVIEDMADAIKNNREPVITADTVRPTLEMALAMYQSAAQNREVTLPVENEEDIWK